MTTSMAGLAASAAASLPLDLLGDPDEISHDPSVCRVPGCETPRLLAKRANSHGGDGSANGYCVRHYRNMQRHGQPEAPSETLHRDFLEAAHAYGDEPGRATLATLAARGVSWCAHKSSLRRGGRTPADMTEDERARRAGAASAAATRAARAPFAVLLALDLPQVRDLARKAYAFTEHPAELPLATFLDAQQAMEMAAETLYQAVPVGSAQPANDEMLPVVVAEAA